MGCEKEDVKFLLAVAMHTADISNPAKPLPICLRWTELVMEEFYRQGDMEAKLGMPISPFYDRVKTSVAQCQMGFVNVLVKPLFAEFTGLLGEPALSDCYSCLEANLKGWEMHGNELLKLSPQQLADLAPEGSKKNEKRSRASVDFSTADARDRRQSKDMDRRSQSDAASKVQVINAPSSE